MPFFLHIGNTSRSNVFWYHVRYSCRLVEAESQMGDYVFNEDPAITDLIERWRNGEDAAFAELFEQYRAALNNMVRTRIGGQLAARMDASDVVQESYLDAFGKSRQYMQNPQVGFFVWLRGITNDRLAKMQRMHLGAQQRAVSAEVQLPNRSSMMLAAQLLASGSSPSTSVRRQELRDQLQRAVESLGETDREVILMRHFEQLSNSQVAQAMGITASTATMRHGRALVRLREAVAKNFSQGGLD